MITEQQLLIDGMHCAACVRRVEKALLKVENVSFASVNLADQTAFVQGTPLQKHLLLPLLKSVLGLRYWKARKNAELSNKLKQNAC